MCGIAGIYSSSFNSPDDYRGLLHKMTEVLHHRGPDDTGFFFSNKLGLGHKRLSIIDLSTGKQPIYNEDQTKCIVFNGEIYNFKEIRKELQGLGHVFSTKTDTETILHAYEEWGEEGCLKRLIGMFAFCIYDIPANRIFIARDRLGIKPVFYSTRNNRLAFSSEMKSILSDPQFKRELNKEALYSYFLFSYIPAPLTIFNDIYKLLPGHYMTMQDGSLSISKYWDIQFDPVFRKSDSDYIVDFMDLLTDATRIRMISDVPLGSFLSGGIDSSSVVALMSKAQKDPVKTFTIGFGGNKGDFTDERYYARLVSKRYHTDHHEYEVMPSLEGIIDKIVRAFDEPFADDSTIPSFYVSELARRKVKVILSGLGGDEAFGGYERYLGMALGSIYQKVPRFMPWNLMVRAVNVLPENTNSFFRVNHIKRFLRSASSDPAERYVGYLLKIRDDYASSLFNEDAAVTAELIDVCKERFRGYFNSDNASDPLDRAFYCDLKTYLPDDILACTDRISMHHSLEVRVPFVDHRLQEYCATIPSSVKMKWFRKKSLLKKGVAPILPAEIINHKKQGFVGPLPAWLSADLRDYTNETLSLGNLDKHGLLNTDTVSKILQDHYSGKETNDILIWSLINFQVWFEGYLE